MSPGNSSAANGRGIAAGLHTAGATPPAADSHERPSARENRASWAVPILQSTASTVNQSLWPITVEIIPQSQLKVVIYHHELGTPVSGVLHCWTYISVGLSRLRQKEVVLTLRRRTATEREQDYNTEPLRWFKQLYSFAQEGKIVDNFQPTILLMPAFLGRFSMVIYCPRTIVNNVPVELFPEERLHAIPLTDKEAEVAKTYGTMRALSHLGVSERWFPFPPWIDRDRKHCITVSDMRGTVRDDLSFCSVLEVSVFKRGGDIVVHVPQRAEKYMKEALDGFKTSNAFPLDSFMYEESDSGMIWKSGLTESTAYSRGTSNACMNLGFILFCPEQEDNAWQREEDGYVLFLTTPTWTEIRKAFQASKPLIVSVENEFRFCLEYQTRKAPSTGAHPRSVSLGNQQEIASSFGFSLTTSGLPPIVRDNVLVLGEAATKTDLFGWTPFCDCSNCDGLCSVLSNESVAKRLVQREKIELFRGQRVHIHSSAIRGCAFAKLLDKTDRNKDTEIVTYSIQRADLEGSTKIFLLAILEGDAKPSQGWHFAAATVPDDPASSIIFSDGPVDPNPMSPRNLRVMNMWLRTCTSRIIQHNLCPTWDPTKCPLPTRVVDVTSQAPRLYTPPPSDSGKYAALSYCWGGPQSHATTAAKLAEYHNALPMEALPATIRDAITLAKALNIPFLWIDSLCIVQDSAQDKTTEVAKMGPIYKNAWVTFSAARAASCHDGFLGIQEATRDRLPRSVTIPIACPDDRVGSVMLTPARFNGVNMRFEDKYPIEHRAWTYQEYLLSPRVISFHHDSIEFKCQAGAQTDDGLKPEELRLNPPMFARSASLEPEFYRLQSQTLDGKNSNNSPDAQRLLRLAWDDVVASYSTGRLTDPDDKLLAISAVAFEFYSLSGDQYLAGLWKANLVHDLQWFTFPPAHGKPSLHQKYHIPTWSWASVLRRSIQPHEAGRYAIQSARIQVLHCSVDVVSKEAPFGHVRGGELTIRGPVKSMSARDAWEQFGCGPGTDEKKQIGMIDPDYRWEVPKDESARSKLGIPPERGPLFFLGLSRRQEDSYETCGLVLLETGDNRYERAGLFKVGASDDLRAIRPYEQRIAAERWGLDYEIRTVSIC